MRGGNLGDLSLCDKYQISISKPDVRVPSAGNCWVPSTVSKKHLPMRNERLPVMFIWQFCATSLKISVLMLALPFMDFQYLCTGSLEQLSCCPHVKLLCSNCSQDFSSPAWIFLSHIYLEQKHFLCSVALPGRFWVC